MADDDGRTRSITQERWKIVGEVLEERAKQVEQGYDAEHDDRQPLPHWAWLLTRRSNDLVAPSLPDYSPDEPRRLLVEISTIALAAIESLDRKAAEPPRFITAPCASYGEPVKVGAFDCPHCHASDADE